MKVIVGLGNPGDEYKNTRHNAGFLFLDKLACNKMLSPVDECLNFQKNDKIESFIAETMHKGEKIFLVKPQTYMNSSGKAVLEILDYYKIDKDDLIVVSDDIDLPLGTVRIRQGGASGGHKGLQNIIDTLQTEEFLRVRIGIRSTNGSADRTEDPADNYDAADFVLSVFTKREEGILKQVLDLAIDYITPFIGKKTKILAHTLEMKNNSL